MIASVGQIESLIGEEVARTVRTEAQTASPDEACGLLVGRMERGRVRITRAIPCPNTAPPERRRDRFTIDPRRVIEEESSLRGSKEEVVGFYHSHPTGRAVPSAADRTFMALWPEVVWLIAGGPDNRAGWSLRAWAWDPLVPEAPREVHMEEVLSEGEAL